MALKKNLRLSIYVRNDFFLEKMAILLVFNIKIYHKL